MTGSQFGVMLVPDQPTALREMVRVTKPGGRVLLIVLGPPADFEALQFFIEAMGTVAPGFHGLPDDPPPLEFQVADPEVLRARLTASGLDAVKIDTTHLERLEFGTGRDCWNWILNSNPIAGSILDEVAKADQAEGSRCPRPEDDSARGRARRRCPHLEAQHRMGLEGRLAMSPSILVVGGGIAGRAVARGLAQHELACTVVERRETAGRGMGVNLPGNAVRALGELGVPTEALARGVPVRRREYRNGGGRLLFAVDDARFWREVAPPVCLRHGDLLAALPLPEGITLEHAHAMTARPTPTDVEVELEGIGLRRFYFVIGADGVHSAMRGAIADDTLCPSSMTGSSWRFVTDNPGVDCWTAWSGRDATFLLIPVEENRVYGYAARTRCGHTGSDPMWLTQASAAFPTVVQTAVAQAVDAGELLKSGVDEVRIDHWQNGRIVLIGDAAHATGPVWAQGVAMAFEDALVLSELLAQTSDESWAGVGADFERIRRPRVEHVRSATEKMSQLAAMPGFVRDVIAPVLGPRNYREAYGPLRQSLGSRRPAHPVSPAGSRPRRT